MERFNQLYFTLVPLELKRRPRGCQRKYYLKYNLAGPEERGRRRRDVSQPCCDCSCPLHQGGCVKPRETSQLFPLQCQPWCALEEPLQLPCQGPSSTRNLWILLSTFLMSLQGGPAVPDTQLSISCGVFTPCRAAAPLSSLPAAGKVFKARRNPQKMHRRQEGSPPRTLSSSLPISCLSLGLSAFSSLILYRLKPLLEPRT